MLIYGQYDVQSVGDESAWDDPPFEPEIRDGRIYARGAADDKGNFLPLLHVACALAREGSLPVNVRVLVEGEEEAGSEAVAKWIHADERGGRLRDRVRRRHGGRAHAGRHGGPARDRDGADRGPHGGARPALGDVRRQRAERAPRAPRDARSGASWPRRTGERGAARGNRAALTDGDRVVEAADARRRGDRRGGRPAGGGRRGRRLLPPQRRRRLVRGQRARGWRAAHAGARHRAGHDQPEARPAAGPGGHAPRAGAPACSRPCPRARR